MSASSPEPESQVTSKDIMARTPRRLRNLNFPAQDAENVQLHEDNLQGPPEIDNILLERPHESTRSIKIIWPNRDVRQILEEFRVKNLSQLNGGKIIVETDENGVPNVRSVSILGQLAENQIAMHTLHRILCSNCVSAIVLEIKRVMPIHLYHMNT